MNCNKGDLVKLTHFWCTILYKDITHELGIVVGIEQSENNECLVRVLFGNRLYWFPEHAVEKIA